MNEYDIMEFNILVQMPKSTRTRSKPFPSRFQILPGGKFKNVVVFEGMPKGLQTAVHMGNFNYIWELPKFIQHKKQEKAIVGVRFRLETKEYKVVKINYYWKDYHGGVPPNDYIASVRRTDFQIFTLGSSPRTNEKFRGLVQKTDDEGLRKTYYHLVVLRGCLATVFHCRNGKLEIWMSNIDGDGFRVLCLLKNSEGLPKWFRTTVHVEASVKSIPCSCGKPQSNQYPCW
ncbi:hypothetical protein FEM48_Zijuj04G0131200 [Ziziphus jujuba var. spinosa]|uniref:Uncharacterized protein n=1 Tax=Ziziphus jujuba var. spinosa TaxID=714518 RepID=A0A978VK25_ZIZJJ|nr:hypothetical protein FEM48_Zijuj04G0131200 [Ziziphus jujuba var. spinosa]